MFNEFCHFILQLTRYADQLRQVYISLCVVNALSSVFSVFTNTLVILAIKRSASLHTPSYVLLCTLAFSDVGVGFIVQPLYIATKIAELAGAKSMYCGFGIGYDIAGNCFASLSFMVITAISLDRFLAVYLRARYRVVVTRKRAITVTFVAGAFAALYGLMGMLNRKAYYVMGLTMVPLCLVGSSFNYLNINRMIRKQQHVHTRTHSSVRFTSSGQDEQHGVDMKQYKSTLKTVMYVYFVFLLCYLPYFFCLLALYLTARNEAIQTSVHVTVTIIFINSSLNPVLYYWRIPEIRRVVRQILHIDSPQG